MPRDIQLPRRQKSDGDELLRILLFPSSLAACVPLGCSCVTHNSYGLRAVVASLHAELPVHAATGHALVAVEYCLRRR